MSKQILNELAVVEWAATDYIFTSQLNLNKRA